MLSHAVAPMRLAAEGWHAPWQTLISIIMSARTRDETTVAVGERLFRSYPTPNALARAPLSAIERIVKPVNFYHTKAAAVRACARELVQRFNGTPPLDRDALVTLPGVGRKTANVFLAEFGVDAIGVDTHVVHVSRSLGWTTHRAPGDIERDLETLFPKQVWRRINAACVHFGKTHTRPSEKAALLASIRSACRS